MNNKKLVNKLSEIEKIGEDAVKETNIENKKLNIPLVFCKDEKVQYEHPDGSITAKDDLK